jgi:hypothetical protein
MTEAETSITSRIEPWLPDGLPITTSTTPARCPAVSWRSSEHDSINPFFSRSLKWPTTTR